uniref:Uncharacterized protein n=1 Tax=Grammatophora oceanica TaxID=210454 RepID=A0A7S1V8Y1_9STRA|mmetsp:Transcript_39938/g.59255  ORF Transcript_39938/g.59255 Transcript_39938/m.59255 type:complete len:127 (+) Transcript_39938:121-501(+)
MPAGEMCFGFDSFCGSGVCVSGGAYDMCAEGSNYKSMAKFETCENTDECKDGRTCNRNVNKCHYRKPGGMLGLCNDDSECEDLYGGGWTECAYGSCKRDTGGYCKNTNFNYYCASGECDASISRCT